ncbi:MAG: universal stress protein [Oscillochloridaceae bacterium umkhey_bin13]
MYNHILVPLDGSALAEQILPHVQTLANVGTRPRLTLLRAVPREYPDVVEGGTVTNQVINPMDELLAEAQSYLEQVAKKLRSEGIEVHCEVLIRHPAEAIIEFANQTKPDLIAIATHGRGGIVRLLHGSITETIMHATPAPMLVVRATG